MINPIINDEVTIVDSSAVEEKYTYLRDPNPPLSKVGSGILRYTGNSESFEIPFVNYQKYLNNENLFIDVNPQLSRQKLC